LEIRNKTFRLKIDSVFQKLWWSEVYKHLVPCKSLTTFTSPIFFDCLQKILNVSESDETSGLIPFKLSKI